MMIGFINNNNIYNFVNKKNKLIDKYFNIQYILNFIFYN